MRLRVGSAYNEGTSLASWRDRRHRDSKAPFLHGKRPLHRVLRILIEC